MKKSVLVLGMISSLVLFSGSLIAKERRGADLVVTKTDDQEIKGELIAVKEASLLLLDSQSGVDVSMAVSDIRNIKVVKKPNFLGAGAGLLIGAVIGGIIGYSAKEQGPGEDYSKAVGVGYGAALLGISGAVIGAVIVGKDKTIRVEGKSPGEINAIMQKLRSQARITDFQ